MDNCTYNMYCLEVIVETDTDEVVAETDKGAVVAGTKNIENAVGLAAMTARNWNVCEN